MKKAESSEEESSEEEESSDEEEAPKAATNGKAKVRASPHLHDFTLVLSIRPYAHRTALHIQQPGGRGRHSSFCPPASVHHLARLHPALRRSRRQRRRAHLMRRRRQCPQSLPQLPLQRYPTVAP